MKTHASKAKWRMDILESKIELHECEFKSKSWDKRAAFKRETSYPYLCVLKIETWHHKKT
jgi:hypothetical protein